MVSAAHLYHQPAQVANSSCSHARAAVKKQVKKPAFEEKNLKITMVKNCQDSSESETENVKEEDPWKGDNEFEYLEKVETLHAENNIQALQCDSPE